MKLYNPRKTKELQIQLTNAEAGIIYINDVPMYKFKYYPSGWKRSEMYSQSSSEPKTWTKFTKYCNGTFFLIEIVEMLLDNGYRINNVEVKSRKDI